MIHRIWAIALNTFREAARVRVLYGILVLVVGANLLAIVLGQMAVNDEARIARDVGLAGISLFGSLTAIFLGVFLLYTEVQRRTIHVIVSKPIARWEFVLGKYLGMALVLSALVAMFTIGMIGVSSVGRWLELTAGLELTSALAKAVVLSWLEVLTVAAIAIFFSSFSTPFLSGIFALGMWVLGRLTPDIESAAQTATPWIRATTRIALEIVPDLHLFSVSGRVVEGSAVSVHADFVSWAYVALSGAHGLGWIAGLLVLAALLFTRRDFA